ncbi:MAG: uncharacterized protein A8A55_0324 [Amphiamblys sp. WSBS2006]|nr:MAG: uncharacterized protein A8A55_0324 [Amphiamblys sp. WSBS2006]
MLTRTILGLFLLRQISATFYPTGEEFTALVGEDSLMLVGFTALSWCPHCKKVPEIFEQVDTLFQQKGLGVKTVILDDKQDNERKHRTAYNIAGYPTILLVKGSESSPLSTRDPQRIVDECVKKMQEYCQGGSCCPAPPKADDCCQGDSCCSAPPKANDCCQGDSCCMESAGPTPDADGVIRPTFKQLLELEKQKKPFLLFSTDHNNCMPCRAIPETIKNLLPILQEKNISIAVAHAERSNDPSVEEIFNRYKVSSIPKIALVNGGSFCVYEGDRSPTSIADFCKRNIN